MFGGVKREFEKEDIKYFKNLSDCAPGINTKRGKDEIRGGTKEDKGGCLKKPKMPEEWKKNRTEWLSNFDIDAVLEQYENIPDFKYLGAVPLDFDKDLGGGYCVSQLTCDLDLVKDYKKGIRKYGMVINLDTHDKGGSHWVSMFSNLKKGGVYFMDSYGYRPEKEIQKFMEKIRTDGNHLIESGLLYPKGEHNIPLKIKKISKNEVEIIDGEYKKLLENNFISINKTPIRILKLDKKKVTLKENLPDEIKINDVVDAEGIGFRTFYNNNRFQFKTSECGTFCIYFIVELIKNRKFSDVVQNLISDDDINRERLGYYRYKD